MLTGISFVLLLFFFTYVGLFGHVPNKKELASLKNPVTSTIFGSDKKPIAYFYMQNRSNIDSLQLNPYLKKALVATEDVRFYEHAGIDYKSYARVLLKSVVLQQGKGGGSTITQQIAKNIFGRKDFWFLSTPISKMREVIIAKRLENLYTKEELLLLYFNTVSFGENLYGIEKAAQRFFNKTPEKLNLAECATLVGVLKAPTYYNPRRNPINATNRRNTVLDQMVKYAAITAEEATAAKTPIVLNYTPPEKNSSLSGYYKEFVKKEFEIWANENPTAEGGIYDLEKDGLNIYTTLQPNIQKYAENAMVRNIERLQKSMAEFWESNTTQGGKEAFINKLMKQQPKVKQLQNQGKTPEEIEQYLQKVTARKYWEVNKGFEPRQQSYQDSVISAIVRLHTGILAMNSRSGAILGYLGGIDYGFSQIDNIKSPKQVGSTFKPITYLTALQHGIDPCDFYDNTLRTYSQYENWQPRNSSGSYGGSYSVHGALANSVNTISVALQMQVGVPKVKKQAEKMGITATIPDVPSIVLGTADVNLLEMVTAYASISNGGQLVQPYMIQKITNEEGKVLFEAKPKYKGRVASEKSIKQLQQIMGEVITEGTGTSFNSYNIPFNIIGKTGTTQNNGDGWFIGASPEIVVGAWVGTQDKRVHFKSTSLGSGARTAMPMVASVFKSLSSWTRPMLTNFEYETPYFKCPAYSELSANEAKSFYASDSTYLKELQLKSMVISLDSLPSKTSDSLVVQ
ncbi:penicillin-binding protein 1A [Patiriisocius marinistellae]|uniref:Penicillin-binding protein 1A n=1 Tax=Patiriisocius marinistellae TaxID=2494560 RepID=A0A5J4FU14_9FLAO|nr:penicillin-binding protein 1A [Patiriisocius marinistellae]